MHDAIGALQLQQLLSARDKRVYVVCQLVDEPLGSPTMSAID